MTKEVKPCPFCGGEAQILDHRYAGTMASGMETPEPYAACRAGCVKMKPVRCDEWPSGRAAGALTYEQARAQAIAAWNRRAPAPPSDAKALDTAVRTFIGECANGVNEEAFEKLVEAWHKGIETTEQAGVDTAPPGADGTQRTGGPCSPSEIHEPRGSRDRGPSASTPAVSPAPSRAEADRIDAAARAACAAYWSGEPANLFDKLGRGEKDLWRRTVRAALPHLAVRVDVERLTFAAFRAANSRRCSTAFKSCDDWNLGDWGNSIAGEVGEACNLIKKKRRGEPVGSEKIADELADVVTYADLIAWKLGVDLDAALVRKFNEVSERVGSPIRLSAQSVPTTEENEKGGVSNG